MEGRAEWGVRLNSLKTELLYVSNLNLTNAKAERHMYVLVCTMPIVLVWGRDKTALTKGKENRQIIEIMPAAQIESQTLST